jgi:hypothetical protein
MIRILMCAVVVMMVGCMVPNEGATSEMQEVTTPDTVCGLPTQCHPFSCTINANGFARCVHNRVADQTCANACGGQATCPGGDDGGCVSLCSSVSPSGPGFDNCYVSCVRNLSRSCQDGSEP